MCHCADAILLNPSHNHRHPPQTMMTNTFHPARRSVVFAGAAGAAGATVTILPALIPSAFGTAPMAGSQAISVHRMKLGN